LSADMVLHAPRSNLDQPAAGMIRHAVLRPLHGSGEQGFLHRVFRGGEVAVAPDDGGENLWRKFAQQVHFQKDPPVGVTTSRTSIGMFAGFPSGPGSLEMLAAISQARSALSQSTIQ